MNIGIITQGSNGDTEIFVSLALQLVKQNHKVALFIVTLNNRDYSFLNEVEGLTVFQKMVYDDFKKEKEDLEFWKKENDLIFVKLHELIEDELTFFSYKFSKENDVVLGSHHIYELVCIAEKFNTPFIAVNYHLELIRSQFNVPLALSHVKNQSTTELWDAFEKQNNLKMKRSINRYRIRNGLKPIKNVLQDMVHSKFLNLIPYSKHLYSAKPDWDNTYKLCGYWESAADNSHWELPKELDDFLSEGDKPVLITVGSMVEHEVDSKSFQNLLLEAASQVNRKVIILSNWKEEGEMMGNIFKLSGFVSYPKLFSKCSVIVHHGGIGAMHQATEAGCPSVVITYGHDQPFNAKVLLDAGLSLGSIHRNDLKPNLLSELINKTLMNKRMMQKAKEVGALLKTENGVDNAIQYIEKGMSSHRVLVSSLV